MSQWGSFVAICIEKSGGVLVVGTTRTAYKLLGRKFHRIILGRRAHGAGEDLYWAINDSLAEDGTLEAWAGWALVDMFHNLHGT